eukprot:NODE_92_length_2703_cov_43.368401_g88_i0.p1 GENE.NODE_92_length_2703_cov_43.368401_g88_i0~~NODE_92_length_2703_cov_43.368401_g88_i0.p1  ORF type:complete len:885 (+),score=212.26 NODE_92_length_2703_cov_43.368401_g88_i0:82-2655(+)
MGSLFKLRDLWSTALKQRSVEGQPPEEFDKKCMVVGNVDNDGSGADKIVVGSFSGVLRVFHPRQKGFKADDMLFEQELDQPILQLEMGALLPNSQNTALAVLHPRKITVYNVVKGGGAGPDNAADPLTRMYTLSKAYEHLLERTSYNFCIGAFNNNFGKDYLCVQSMDGQLSFFEQDKFIFARYLNNFLIPGQLCFCKRMESFITSTATFEVECYKYTGLASSSGSEEKKAEESSDTAPGSASAGKKLQVHWTCNLGEDVVDIRVAKYSKALSAQAVDVVVLGERTLFCVKEDGTIRSQKRLDYFPACLYPYQLPNGNTNLIIGTHNNSLQIFADPNLAWAAKMQHVPCSVATGSFAKTDGMMVVLTQDGNLSVNYLGTDPANNPVQLAESKELDYEEMDEEHRRLQALIRQAVNAGKAEPREQVVIKLDVPDCLDDNKDANFDDSDRPQHAHSATVKLTLSYTGEDDIENAVLTVSVPSPFMLEEQTIVIPQLSGSLNVDNRSPTVDLTFYLPDQATGLIPTSLSTSVLVAYTNAAGEPLTTKANFFLPMALAGTVIPPVKTPTYKITLDTSTQPPVMGQIFEEVLRDKGELASAGNVLSFQYYNSHSLDATILVSKNASRYRIQSANFESLWLLTSELVRRLKRHFEPQATDSDPFTIKYSDNLPFQEYFQVIDAHFKARQALTASQQSLSERAHQFRSIQKRLLVRFKDRNPSPLANLDLLFEDTYKQLMDISKKVEADQQALAAASNVLTCATNLMLLLIRYRFQMKKEDFKVLQHYLSPVVVDSQTQGWEECTDAAMTHLLRTCLAKNVKESSSMPQPLQVPNDINKLKKHIALVCDRLAKGGSLRMETRKK